MPNTSSRPLRAYAWALTATVLPAAVIAALAYSIAVGAEDTSCDGFGCASFGYGVIGVYAASAVPVVGVLGLLATAGLGASRPSLRTHPARLGLLGALTAWIVLALIATTL